MSLGNGGKIPAKSLNGRENRNELSHTRTGLQLVLIIH